MLDNVFPQPADDHYSGHKLAKWLLFFYTVKSFVAGSVHMLASDGGAQSIASITLDEFTQGGADSVVTIFGLWGMEQVVIGIVGAIVLWRYKSLIPMMAMIYAIEYLGRFAHDLYTPGVQSANTPPGAVADYVLVPLALVMFVLSLWQQEGAASREGLLSGEKEASRQRH